jgi:hypothetical protein
MNITDPKTQDFECIPRDLKAIPRWLVWKFNDNGGKVPQGKTGNVSAHDPTQWMTFERAVATFNRILANRRWKHGGGIGFVFTDDDDIGGVDLDGCRDPTTGNIASWATRLLELYKPAYVERSPSGKGFHIISRGAPKVLDRTQRPVESPDLVVEGKDAGIEAYVNARFFTVTGDHVTGRMDSLQVMHEAWVQIDGWLRGDEARHERDEVARSAGREPDGPEDIERVRSALAAFGSDDLDRNGWIGIGMALKGEFGDEGEALWLEWMAKSPHDDADDNAKTWRGLPDKPLKVGIGTIIYHAKQHGWVDTKKPGAGSALLEAIERGAVLWHDERDLPFATVKVIKADGSSHYENLPVDGAGFTKWLQREFYLATGGIPKRDALKGAIDLASAKATFDGQRHQSWIRVAEAGGKIYVDLGDEDWTAIEVDGDGWRVCPEPPVKFRRPAGTEALPVPAHGRDVIARLGELIRPRRPEHMKLLVGWLVACLRPTYPIPTLVFACEHGSAKTSALRGVRSVVDPRVNATPGLPTNEKDVIISAHQQWLLAADNITSISPVMSDILCRVVTGGGISGRSLYTNEDVSNVVVKRPVALTAIGTPTMRADFVDRSITVPLRKIEQGEYLSEDEVNKRWAALQPDLLGMLLDGASAALRRLDEAKRIHAGRLPRMADFALWVEAAGEAFGWRDGEFLDAYLEMLNERLGDTAADDPLCSLIFEWILESVKGGSIEAPAGELLERLTKYADWSVEFSSPRHRSPANAEWFPQRPRGLSSRLESDRRLLEALGVSYSSRPHPHSRTRGQLHCLTLNERGRAEEDERFRKFIGA